MMIHRKDTQPRQPGPNTTIASTATWVGVLEQAGFTATEAEKCPGAYIAVLERNGFRVRVILCPLRDHQTIGLSRLRDGKREHLVHRTGTIRDHEWVPYSMADAVQAALSIVRQIGGQR